MGYPKVVTREGEKFDVLDYMVVDGITSMLISNMTSHNGTNQPIFSIKEDNEACDCSQDCWMIKWTAYTPNYDYEIRI